MTDNNFVAMSENKYAVYFSNLNSLRFFAAMFIIFEHINRFKTKFLHLQNHAFDAFSWLAAYVSLSALFAISGFLITFLLLNEKKIAGTISVWRFYMRRLYRIWPLYYVVVILIFFVIPYFIDFRGFFYHLGITNSFDNNFGKSFLYALIFIPELVIKYSPILLAIGPAWTLTVEEPFYAIWPLIIKKVKRPSYSILIIIGSLFMIKLLCMVYEYIYHKASPISRFFLGNQYECVTACVLIGSLGGALLSENKKIVQVLFQKKIQIALYGLFLLSFLLNCLGNYFGSSSIIYEYYAFIITCILINLAANRNSILSVDTKVFTYLGKISYGLYIYNVPILFAISYYTTNIYIIVISTVLLTIAAAILSYEIVEKRFLRAKVKYSVVITGDNVENRESAKTAKYH